MKSLLSSEAKERCKQMDDIVNMISLVKPEKAR